MKLLSSIPIFRIFDVKKAKEFYVDYLGFSIDWEHRFAAHAPLYMQISRGNLVLHLSEHYGDSTPGSAIRVPMTGVDAFHKEVTAKHYRYLHPGVETKPWNTRDMSVIDPFGNRIHFSESLSTRPSRKGKSAAKKKR
jgi:catechol 2,3-dioxygenase-like lactoylglutathione lyase family enzyme